jgi:hypothetical protein
MTTSLGSLGPASGIDVFVVTLDPGGGGSSQWIEGGNGEDRARAVAMDSDSNVIVAGTYQNAPDFGGGAFPDAGVEVNIFVAKYDSPVPNLVWAEAFGSSGDQFASGMAVDQDDNIVLTGLFDGAFTFGGPQLTPAGGPENYDIFVAKLDPGGNHVWSQRFGDDTHQDGRAVAVDPCGNVLATGLMYGTFSFGGPELTTAGPGIGMFPDDLYVVKLAP